MVRQTSGGAAIGKAGAVQVMESGLNQDSRSDYNERQIANRLQSAITDRLMNAGKFDPRGPTIVVNVTDLCIHSTAAVVWVGMMAGRDQLEAHVRVVQGGRTLREFTASTKRFAGMLTGPGATYRVKLLCDHLADDLTRQL
jgi:hypothetical protein